MEKANTLKKSWLSPARQGIGSMWRRIQVLITDINDEDKVLCWADVWPAAYGLATIFGRQLILTDEKLLNSSMAFQG